MENNIQQKSQNKNCINQSSKKQDDYDKFSNSNNHSQMESSEEFAIEEDMMEYQHNTEDVQQFNTQNFYNRQHYSGNRIVPQTNQKKSNK